MAHGISELGNGGSVRGSRGAEAASRRAEDTIRAANEELRLRTGDQLGVPIAVLVDQRDAAYRQLEAARQEGDERDRAVIAEHDAFITFLMEDHESQLRQVADQLDRAREELGRERALRALEDSATESEPDDPRRQIASLQRELEAAYAEIDETRADTAHLQAQRDDALRAGDDVQVHACARVEAALDQAFQLQTDLDAANRLLEDERDAARDASLAAARELDAVRRELDVRNVEVRQLRDRPAELTEEAPGGVPPPPTATQELQAARDEVQRLRQRLIDNRRELSRMSRELQLARATKPNHARSVVPAGLHVVPGSGR
jgi:hypothetical protein